MVISEKNASTSRFETCHLHDMMREVCLLKTEEENFLQIVHGSSSSTAYSKSHRKPRKLAVHRPDETFSMEKEVNSPSLRSLLFIWGSGWRASGLFFERLHLMRVLDLSRAHFEGGKIPSSIGKLIHLRYLSLYKAHVSCLPSSMRNLKQLVYLNLCLYARYPLYVPNIFKGMQELRYLSLPSGRMHDKTKLELGNLINLETLKFFSTKHSSVTDLHCMTRLRNLLIIFNEEGCTMETLSSSLSKLRHLESLSIDYNHFKVCAPSNDDDKGFVLDCIHLKKLELCIYMPGLPDETHLPSHLTTISLTGCCLKEDPMLILEKLLHLKEVDLGKRSFCGRRMVCSRGGFPQLQMLLFLGLHEWEEWIVEEGSMPLLHTLDVSYCAKLKEVPNGIQFLTSLKYLCMGEEWKQSLSEGGEDYYKVQHVISVRFGGKA
ncbi:probable disease resistance protein At1g58602 [Raphanus sativus]|uniref:Probable disease resistance protein At1g58602 n=1 Tax=Raphanus sativus TaxID=3726 RepID=A0A9W3DU99_RAPSA|nr:probable disease resistance protein At1g58602 [Raphanus sativus]